MTDDRGGRILADHDLTKAIKFAINSKCLFLSGRGKVLNDARIPGDACKDNDCAKGPNRDIDFSVTRRSDQDWANLKSKWGDGLASSLTPSHRNSCANSHRLRTPESRVRARTSG